jgi:hypothetical protein
MNARFVIVAIPVSSTNAEAVGSIGEFVEAARHAVRTLGAGRGLGWNRHVIAARELLRYERVAIARRANERATVLRISQTAAVMNHRPTAFADVRLTFLR